MLKWLPLERCCQHLSVIKLLACVFILCGLSACAEIPYTSTDTESQLKEGQLSDQEIKAQLQGSAGAGDDHPGSAIYLEHCANCHDAGVARAPARNIMELLSPNSVLNTLTNGVMRQQTAALSDQQKKWVVEYLVGATQADKPALDLCAADQTTFDWSQHPLSSGWGTNEQNARHVSSEQTELNANNIHQLEIKWVFDYPLAARARSQPSIAGGAVHVGSQSGTLYSLDQTSGCVRWVYEAGAEVRTGITIPDWGSDRSVAIGYLSDVTGNVHAIDLSTGKGVWKTKVDDHPNATLTAQPVHFEGKIYQAVSSLEVVPAADPNYACCSFRGSIAVLNGIDGELLNKIYTIPEAPSEVGKNNVGTPILSPSGAPVWNSPTVDKKLRRIYFGTGENYSSPAESHSDAIIAVDIDKQKIVWARQTTERDAWNVACMEIIANKTNCPIEKGPDLDFGAPPILVQAEQKPNILVAGQKSGEVFGIDPEDGALLWRNKIGRGGIQGGVHFGMAADGRVVYVPMSDYTEPPLSLADAKPGIYAVDAYTGELLWSHPAPEMCGDRVDCDSGVSAAITSIDGAVIAGHMDGMLRAYAKTDGEILWEVETDTDFTATSGRIAHGGSFGGGSGPVAHRNMLFANSGYGLYFHRSGNVLIAWGLPE